MTALPLSSADDRSHRRRAEPPTDGPSLASYLNEIGAHPLLSREQEAALARRVARGGDDAGEALDALVSANLRFVVSVAKRYQHLGLALSDLIGEGNLGLVRAARRFDATQGVKFISYAVWWIRQAIFQALAEHSRIVRLPVHRAGAVFRVSRHASALQQELGREATVAELARRAALTESDVEIALAVPQRAHVSLDAPLARDADDPLRDRLADRTTQPPDEPVMEHFRSTLVETALASLRPREARILRLYYGFDGEPLTLEEIAARLGVTRERVRQIKERALSRLRRSAAAASLAQLR
ncbi:RNA polymerase sigma factor, sigma-70 family (plasmid) [Gemmatirosa kalamazoonensis]|uniref:RNA polymerase sigma factor, sigma-70 family n=1 Tax=Gemmatirosa kalamazoonensis TaxID=861299 RepID=W0RPD3_9BACT|nr:RNA polymerase sigma factor RpoD/SigA [Gemmatirosa kalamazoonensis]AHG92596.1 RNA polymerase sigma factor, sigma-70 family [Gemmatirosa kalamazoonensis]